MSNRTGRVDNRLSPRNWRLRPKLAVVLLVPGLLAVVLGGLRILDQSSQAAELDRLATYAEAQNEVAVLVERVSAERLRSTAFVAGGRVGNPEALEQSFTEVDSTRNAVRPVVEALVEANTELAAGYRGAEQALSRLESLRTLVQTSNAPASAVITRYSDLITALVGLDDTLLRGIDVGEVSGLAGGLAGLSGARNEISLQYALLTAAATGDEPPAAFAQELANSEARLNQNFGAFRGPLDPAQRVDYGFVIANGANAARGTLVQQTLSRDGVITPEQGADTSQTYELVLGEVDATEDGVRDELTETTAELRTAALGSVIVNLVVLLLALIVGAVLVLVIARSMVDSLRTLRTSAMDVAEKRLPEAVSAMREGKVPDVDISPVPVDTREEMGEVARAFDAVHTQAVRLAAEQATLQNNVNRMFVNLSRRSQALVDRQLQLIEQLESREQDPDQLSNLFRLDHLATRMRRNSENLLVLAGTDVAKRSSHHVPAIDVLQAAVSEVEQYQRITVEQPPPLAVSGRAANDVQHLLSELLDNATTFSSPESQVRMSTTRVGSGPLVIEVADQGVGMPATELAEINRRLGRRSEVTVTASRRMGLFVVGRLSSRHGIEVRLVSGTAHEPASRGAASGTDNRGLIARVTIPAQLVIGGETRSPQPVKKSPQATGLPAGMSTRPGTESPTARMDGLPPADQRDRSPGAAPSRPGVPAQRDGGRDEQPDRGSGLPMRTAGQNLPPDQRNAEPSSRPSGDTTDSGWWNPVTGPVPIADPVSGPGARGEKSPQDPRGGTTPRDTGPTGAGSRDFDPRYPGSRDSEPRRTGSRDSDPRHALSRDPDPWPTGSRDSDPRHTGVPGTRQTGSTPRHTGSRDSDPRHTGAPGADPRQTGSRDTEPQRTSSRAETPPHDPAQRDAGLRSDQQARDISALFDAPSDGDAPASGAPDAGTPGRDASDRGAPKGGVVRGGGMKGGVPAGGAPARGDSSGGTPIFEEVSSGWFRTYRQVPVTWKPGPDGSTPDRTATHGSSTRRSNPAHDSPLNGIFGAQGAGWGPAKPGAAKPDPAEPGTPGRGTSGPDAGTTASGTASRSRSGGPAAAERNASEQTTALPVQPPRTGSTPTGRPAAPSPGPGRSGSQPVQRTSGQSAGRTGPQPTGTQPTGTQPTGTQPAGTQPAGSTGSRPTRRNAEPTNPGLPAARGGSGAQADRTNDPAAGKGTVRRATAATGAAATGAAGEGTAGADTTGTSAAGATAASAGAADEGAAGTTAAGAGGANTTAASTTAAGAGAAGTTAADKGAAGTSATGTSTDSTRADVAGTAVADTGRGTSGPATTGSGSETFSTGVSSSGAFGATAPSRTAGPAGGTGTPGSGLPGLDVPAAPPRQGEPSGTAAAGAPGTGTPGSADGSGDSPASARADERAPGLLARGSDTAGTGTTGAGPDTPAPGSSATASAGTTAGGTATAPTGSAPAADGRSGATPTTATPTTDGPTAGGATGGPPTADSSTAAGSTGGNGSGDRTAGDRTANGGTAGGGTTGRGTAVGSGSGSTDRNGNGGTTSSEAALPGTGTTGSGTTGSGAAGIGTTGSGTTGSGTTGSGTTGSGTTGSGTTGSGTTGSGTTRSGAAGTGTTGTGPARPDPGPEGSVHRAVPTQAGSTASNVGPTNVGPTNSGPTNSGSTNGGPAKGGPTNSGSTTNGDGGGSGNGAVRRAVPLQRNRIPFVDEAEFASSADAGWAAASKVASSDDPDASLIAASGLPRRTPGARLLPGSAGGSLPQRPTRSAEQIRGRLADYQRGVRQGRVDRANEAAGTPTPKD